MVEGLIALVRHARPAVDPTVASARWPLSDEGRAQAAAMAEELRGLRLDRLVASEEPKAAETAAVAAGVLGVPWATAPDLHEHVRTSVDYLEEPEFLEAMRGFFGGRPFGDETADEAGDRFDAALVAVVDAWPGERLAVVAHGTVIALHLARHGGLDAYERWRSLPLAGVVPVS